MNLTGSPDYTPRIQIIGDTGSGCSNNQYAQFNVNAFAGPTYNSNAMESGRNYMRGCFQSIWDLALARNVRLGGNRNFQLRLEVYNVLNSSTYTSRSTTVQYQQPDQPDGRQRPVQCGRHPEREPAQAEPGWIRRGDGDDRPDDHAGAVPLLVLTS